MVSFFLIFILFTVLITYSKMTASEYIVKPLVDQLVNDIVKQHERKQREAKKLEPTGT